jgi:hypothetical protein
MQALRRNRQEWARLVTAFERSRSSMAEFCARPELVARTFGWWRWRLGRDERSAKRDTDDVRLVPIDVVRTTPQPRANMMLLPVAGVEMHVQLGTDVAYIAALVTELRSRPNGFADAESRSTSVYRGW